MIFARPFVLMLLVASSMQDGLPENVDANGRVDYGSEFFTDGLKTKPVFGAVARAMRKFIPEGASVLDVGCGHGMTVSALRDTGLAAVHCVEGDGCTHHSAYDFTLPFS